MLLFQDTTSMIVSRDCKKLVQFNLNTTVDVLHLLLKNQSIISVLMNSPNDYDALMFGSTL